MSLKVLGWEVSLKLADLRRHSTLNQMQCTLEVFVISKKPPEVHPIFNHLKNVTFHGSIFTLGVNSGTRPCSATWRPLSLLSPCQFSMKRVFPATGSPDWVCSICIYNSHPVPSQKQAGTGCCSVLLLEGSDFVSCIH